MQSNYPTEIRLSEAAKAALGRVPVTPGTTVFDTLSPAAKFLVALNAKARRTGSPIFAGVGLSKRAKRRAAGRIAKASRKRNRRAA